MSATLPTFLGIDIGAGGIKTTLVRQDGRVVATASHELKTARPHLGWTEQDPADWYVAMRDTIRRILAAPDAAAEHIAAIGFSAGTHTAVLMDGDGQVLRPAILWSDQRSGDEAKALNERFGDRLLEIGYHRAAPTWTLAQFLWVRRHEPEVAAKCRRVLFAKDWLRSRLTGDVLTDRIDALGSLMLDARSEAWSAELCGMIEWPLSTLPPIVPSKEIAGQVTDAAARDLGLRAGTPVIVGCSDTAIEAYGAGAIENGQGVFKLATAGAVSVMGDRPHPHARLINYYHPVPGMWYTIAATNSCASAHKWLRDLFFGREAAGDPFGSMDELARTVPPGAEGLLFHPYLEGERSPYWDPHLRADFIGLTMRHDRQHLVRALYEGIAFSLRDCLSELTAQGLVMSEGRLIGGGAKSPLWRQIIADVTGIEMLQPETGDASFGAALLAGVGVGAFADERDAVRTCVRIVSTNRPDPERHAFYGRLFELYKESQTRLVELNHRLRELSLVSQGRG